MVSTAIDALRAGLQAGALLTGIEQERSFSYRSSQAQTEFVGGHYLTRLCASRWTGVPVHAIRLKQVCEGCGGPHGRPELVGAGEVFVSISHSGGVVAAAVTDDPGGVGVDVEAINAGAHHLSDQARRRVLTPGEYQAVVRAEDPDMEFLRLWVRKEALIKVGEANLDGMSQIEVLGAGVSVGEYRLFDFSGEGHVGSIASAVDPTFHCL